MSDRCQWTTFIFADDIVAIVSFMAATGQKRRPVSIKMPRYLRCGASDTLNPDGITPFVASCAKDSIAYSAPYVLLARRTTLPDSTAIVYE